MLKMLIFSRSNSALKSMNFGVSAIPSVSSSAVDVKLGFHHVKKLFFFLIQYMMRELKLTFSIGMSETNVH